MQECAKFHIFLRQTRLTLCIKCQPGEGKKIDVMTCWLANVIENDKNYDEKGELRVLLLCRCIKAGEAMTLGLIRYVATSARVTGERGRAESVSGRCQLPSVGALESRSVQSNAYIMTLWRERRNNLSVIATNTPIRAAPRKTTEELPGINSMKDDRN